ncbi:TPA: hypothetical protein OZI11_002488 [Staphylococcus aureus]|uniref:hypothetical protein n=1 Tax=Staphylococcus aureus TaxID=1280 RepID=UPI001CC45576|nr:hypothetical protein [Staphylococcus aureus]MBZ5280808.1 hypothetical protein [Staphylococcus aureus]HCX2884269.1 hypothetical protein [Staphylococcus aureus]
MNEESERRLLYNIFACASNTMVMLAIIYVVAILNGGTIYKIVHSDHRDFYYLAVTVVIVGIMVISNIYVYKIVKKSQKIQSFLIKLFD